MLGQRDRRRQCHLPASLELTLPRMPPQDPKFKNSFLLPHNGLIHFLKSSYFYYLSYISFQKLFVLQTKLSFPAFLPILGRYYFSLLLWKDIHFPPSFQVLLSSLFLSHGLPHGTAASKGWLLPCVLPLLLEAENSPSIGNQPYKQKLSKLRQFKEIEMCTDCHWGS